MKGVEIRPLTSYDEIYYNGQYCGDLLLNGIFRYFPITPKKVVSFMLGQGFIGKPLYFDAT